MDTRPHYFALKDVDEDADHGTSDYSPLQPRSPFRLQRILLLAALLTTNAAWLLVAGLHWTPKISEQYHVSSLTGIDKYPTIDLQMRWWTSYSAEHENQTSVADQAWDALKPAHGFVAVDPKWAEEHDLLPSMQVPSNSSKRVYVLEGYHMLHCLKVVRKTFYQILRGETPDFHLSHTNHCFDALRQNVICHADDALLYTFGRGSAGDGQSRQCRDWAHLRQWATDNTACYLDHENTEGGKFFHCDDGDDGMILTDE